MLLSTDATVGWKIFSNFSPVCEGNIWRKISRKMKPFLFLFFFSFCIQGLAVNWKVSAQASNEERFLHWHLLVKGYTSGSLCALEYQLLSPACSEIAQTFTKTFFKGESLFCKYCIHIAGKTFYLSNTYILLNQSWFYCMCGMYMNKLHKPNLILLSGF